MPFAGDEVAEFEARQEPRLVRALEMVAPGTAVREGLDNIVPARTGALICIGESRGARLPPAPAACKLDVDYTPALLYQLAKMDGAIMLAANGTKILLGERAADAGPHDPLARDGHPAPHRRARLQADRRPRDRHLGGPRAWCRSTSTGRSTSSRTFPWCWPRPTRRWPRSTSTAAASTRSPPASPRSSSRAASRCTTCSPCSSAPSWSPAWPWRSSATSWSWAPRGG